mmetsp:Transcript_113727/g.317634  ORF Transcript_113727/g.317634 Transcript_113727/m.317634 type:complete len:313 (+) Transcript_113727:100-1038(+)
MSAPMWRRERHEDGASRRAAPLAAAAGVRGCRGASCFLLAVLARSSEASKLSTGTLQRTIAPEDQRGADLGVASSLAAEFADPSDAALRTEALFADAAGDAVASLLDARGSGDRSRLTFELHLPEHHIGADKLKQLVETAVLDQVRDSANLAVSVSVDRPRGPLSVVVAPARGRLYAASVEKDVRKGCEAIVLQVLGDGSADRIAEFVSAGHAVCVFDEGGAWDDWGSSALVAVGAALLCLAAAFLCAVAAIRCWWQKYGDEYEEGQEVAGLPSALAAMLSGRDGRGKGDGLAAAQRKDPMQKVRFKVGASD